MQALSVLFGFLLTVVTSILIGRILLRKAAVNINAQEETPLAFVTGSAILSLIIFLLAAMHLVYRGVFLAVAVLVVVAAWRTGAHRRLELRSPALPALWRWMFAAGFGIFTVLYFFNAMAPEFSPDGVSYHLALVARFIRAHGFVRIPYSMYAQLSEGIEMLFLFAFAFGRHSAAALVHFAFMAALALSILNYGRRIGYPGVGAAAALFLYASPVVGMDGTSAYIDVAVASILFAIFYLLEIWDQERTNGLAAIIGLTAGFAYAAKYTAFLALPYAMAFVLWRARRLRPAILIGLCSLVLIAPWMIKDLLWTGNPVSPMLNRVFPNPIVHISFETEWTHQLRSYGIEDWWTLIRELILKGNRLAGAIGPLFFFIPISLLSLRLRAGRRVIFPAILFTLPYFANVGARFFISPLPFWSLAIALAFARFPVALATLAVLQCVISWPPVLRTYSGKYIWALDTIPFRQALRLESEDSWLSRKHADYLVARLLNRLTPPGSRIFSMDGRAGSYTSRDIAVKFESATGELAGDFLGAAFVDDMQARYQQDFHFAAQSVRKFRVVETADAKESEQWAITELRVLSQGTELPRAPYWRLTSRPNPWDIQLAFDNSPVTRWRTWEPFRAGMFIEVDFGSPRTIDEVRIETSITQAVTRLRLDSMDEHGQWRTISNYAAGSELRSPGFFGKQAIAEVKALGLDYLLLDEKGWFSPEIMDDPAGWGVTEVGHSGLTHLFRIDLTGPELVEWK